MKSSWDIKRYFEVPRALVYLLVTLNIAAYLLCWSYSGTLSIPIDLLFRNGAMYAHAVDRHEYWRLLAYGFLHADVFHLVTNMLCLTFWGGHLERRIGALYFVLIYLGALVAGGIVSNVTHTGQYVMVGASGAISGIMGALVCLWFLGATELSANFFVVNLGLNLALALSSPRIDGGAHFGGFAAGLIFCAVLDLVEKANALVLRCKFPEFVKLNGFVVLAGTAIVVFGSRSTRPLGPDDWLLVLIYAMVCIVVIKGLDLVLAMKHGLAAVVVIFAITNAALAWVVGHELARVLGGRCAPGAPVTGAIASSLGSACSHPDIAVTIGAACVLVLTGLLYLQEFDRGLKDIGFISTSLRAERRRRRSI